MKQQFLLSVLTFFLFMILSTGLNAQEKKQTRLHITIEENGSVTTDTSVSYDRTLSEDEVQAIISDITGEIPHPCQAHKHNAMQGDSLETKGKHKDVEVRIMHGASGEEPVWVGEDGDAVIVNKGHGYEEKCIKVITKNEADSLHAEKTKVVTIIEIRDENDGMQEGPGEKKIEKKIIVTEDGGEKAEKTNLIESPEKTEKSKQEKK